MGANACVAFFGIRYQISPEEIDGLETRKDSRMVAAKNSGLSHYWANFGGLDEQYLLFVGTKLTVLGPEYDVEFEMDDQEVVAVMEQTQSNLKRAGLVGVPKLYLQWLPDV